MLWNGYKEVRTYAGFQRVDRYGMFCFIIDGELYIDYCAENDSDIGWYLFHQAGGQQNLPDEGQAPKRQK